MEEKERYIIDRFDEDIFDTKKEYYPSNQTICEIINKQDKRIKELEQENQQLKQQLATAEKALELACETIKQMCGKPLWIGGNIPSPEPKDSEYFKDLAKEMLDSE